MDPEVIAARVWPGAELELERLGGGITNHNFKVLVNGEAFVLRIAGADTGLLGIDRGAEHAAAQIAARLGVGPEVVAFVDDSLVTRFVEGEPVPLEEMRRPEVLAEAAALLRRVHDGPAFPARFDSFRVVETYRRRAEEHGVAVPNQYETAKAHADEVEQALGPKPLSPCHNDLLNANFIRGPDGITIVDWEYAGMGDRFFDIANFAINHELESEQDALLLERYFGERRERDLAHLKVMRFMSDFREAMWGVVQQGISELDFDFVDYARRHFGRLERTVADPAFAQALAILTRAGYAETGAG